jgi:hypothetical protein
MKKELDNLPDAGRSASASLQIAGASHLSAIDLTKKLQLVLETPTGG